MFQFLAGILAFFYGLIPNYAIAIALLTLTVMLVLSPLTIKSTRSMLAMQKLQPDLKRLQQEHKGDRQALNEAMMALYKEHGIRNPVAGCLPMLLQAPVFLVMYQVIQGLTRSGGPDGGFRPKYLDESTRLYRDLRDSGGTMKSFGIDLAKSATEGHSSFGAALPFFILVALVVLTQYYQSRQSMSRNKAAAANPQQQIIMKVLPAVFGVISLSILAGLNVYFLVSALFRIAQTGAMYRFDPKLAAHAKSHAADLEAKITKPNTIKANSKPVPNTKKQPPRPAAGTGSSGRAQTKGNGSRPPAKRRTKKGR